jgi:hypothetical protein
VIRFGVAALSIADGVDFDRQEDSSSQPSQPDRVRIEAAWATQLP